MDIYTCCVCQHNAENYRKLSKHIRDNHFPYIKQYYDRYLLKEGEDRCLQCGGVTKFGALSFGYETACSKSCAAKLGRRRLKEDEKKFQAFTAKVSENQKNIWSARENTGEKLSILESVHSKGKKWLSSLSEDERRIKLSRYHTCDEETINRINQAGAAHLLKLNQMGATGYMKTLTGRFSPKNPKKYNGDPTNIIFRSSYEFKLMKYLDKHPSVIEWSSEELAIPYISPVDGKRHRYYPDFLVTTRKADGTTQTTLLEVKPKHQTIEPQKQTKKTKRYITEVMTYGVNKAKWEAAEIFCQANGWEFQIITEDHLFSK